MTKYLLSTGEVTTKLERYIADLFKIELVVYPGDIPGSSSIGTDFIMTNTMKADLPNEVETRANQLVRKIAGKFSGVDIALESVSVIDETRASLVIRVNHSIETIETNIIEK